MIGPDADVRASYAAFTWSALFGLMHIFWIFAWYYWPAAGRATLGPDFEWAFGRPGTQAYDLVVAMLFGVAALLALAGTRPDRRGVPRLMVAAGLPTAGWLLFVRGALGVILDLLALAGLVGGDTSPLMFYDFWFLLGGTLFLLSARSFRRGATAALTPA